ncbi:MAG: MFS transporter, partial [Planctomycetota bacterium]
IIGVVTDVIGYQWVALIGFLATAICIFILAAGKDYGSVLLPCILLGIGAMALNTAGNTMAPQVLFEGKNPAAASNLANVFFGLGLFLTPLVVSFLFRKTSYEKAVGAMGIIVALPAIFVLMAKGYPVSSAKLDVVAAGKLLAEPAVLVAAFALFCYIALEASFCNWLPSFGKEVLKKEKASIEESVADASAQRLLSLFAIAMMVGRLATSFLPGKIGFDLTADGGYVIAGAAVISAVIIFFMMGCGKGGMANILAILAGLAFAPCFPTTVGVTFAKFSPEVYGSVFGIIFAIGLAGAVIIPKMIGNVAKGATIQKSLKLLLPACVILAILAFFLGQIKSTVETKETVIEETKALEVETEIKIIDELSSIQMAPLPLELPKPMFVGTPENLSGIENLEPDTKKPRPAFLAPENVKNLALNKPVTSSEMDPITGTLDMIVDGDKEASEGSVVELGPFEQWVVIDLEDEYELYAIVFWHFHKTPRVYHDVAVQVSTDPEFITDVTTLFSNDIDNSLGLGVGQGQHYIDKAEGKLVDARGTKARYVKLWSQANNQNDYSHYIEVEVYGK